MISETDLYQSLREAELSKAVSAILNFFEDTKSAFYANYEEVNRQDRLSTDRSHQLELKDMTDEELLEWAHRHRDELRERREVKDSVTKALPLVEYIDGDAWSAAAKELRVVLGKLRQTEQHMSTRLYRYKVLNESDIMIQHMPTDSELAAEAE